MPYIFIHLSQLHHTLILIIVLDHLLSAMKSERLTAQKGATVRHPRKPQEVNLSHLRGLLKTGAADSEKQRRDDEDVCFQRDSSAFVSVSSHHR